MSGATKMMWVNPDTGGLESFRDEETVEQKLDRIIALLEGLTVNVVHTPPVSEEIAQRVMQTLDKKIRGAS